MKTNLLISVASAAVLASSMAAAGTTSLSDDALSQIAGKDNNATFTTSTTVALTTGDTSNGNVQVGFYQWEDSHTNDISYAKGGNTANGDTSMVQASVTGENNIFGWGAAAQVSTNIAGGGSCNCGIGDSFNSESWGTLMVGGF
jgi:hypothetical protein